MSGLSVSREQQGDAVLLKLEGRLDTNTSPDFGDKLLAALGGTKALTLDLSGVDYVSSAGLRALLAGQKKADEQAAAMTLRGVQPAVMEVLDMTGFLEFLRVE